MNTFFPDHCNTIEISSVFERLRRRLAQELPCRELADLLASVDAMERAHNTPEEFNLRFEEFVYRAEEYLAAVRPFYPTLVRFLPSRNGNGANSGNCGFAASRTSESKGRVA